MGLTLSNEKTRNRNVCACISEFQVSREILLFVLLLYAIMALTCAIREIPDHATFRVKGANLAWLDKLGDFLSLALCNLANFDHLWFPKYSVLYIISIC